MANVHYISKNIIRQRPELTYIRNDGADKEFHTHLHPEFIFIEKGSGRFETQDNQYPIKTGDIIICSKGFPHCEYLFSESSVFHLGMKGVILGNMAEDEVIDEPFCIIHTENKYEILRAYFMALKFEDENKSLACGKLIEEDLLRLILLSVLRQAVSDMNLVYNKNKSFFEAKEYIDNNFLTIDSIEEVAKLLGLNKFYLIYIFNTNLGMPPIKYILCKRMEKAKQLLLSTTIPISSIANRCGYKDVAYFSRVFKKLEKMSPMQYRTKQRKGEII